MNTLRIVTASASTLLLAWLCSAPPADASSHREAPGITNTPKLDATDFYMFRSYESGREGYVTFVANYLPLQDPYGGPNYFALDPDAFYDIKIDNDGDAKEDITFRFRFQSRTKSIALQIGAPGRTRTVDIPLINAGPIVAGDTAALNRIESYTVDVLRGYNRFGYIGRNGLTSVANGSREFTKPVDNIGQKSLPDYAAYAADFVYDVNIPGCGQGRLFAGQRKDPFVVNLGETFDLINLNPVGDVAGAEDTLCDKNVTALVLEVPIACVVSSPANSTIGAWTTASLPIRRLDSPDRAARAAVVGGNGAFAQVSRLSMPLVNEVVIGLSAKDRFNASEPKDDAQFLTYVTHPTLPALIQLLFNVPAPSAFPRTDLVAAFLTGLDGLNRTARPAEMQRLNTSIPPKAAAQQSNLGALGGDLAGFPNGRRPGDDVVDIELRVAMGALLDAAAAPAGQLPLTDGAFVDASYFDETFPYLRTPVPGSPNGQNEGTCGQ